MKPAKSRVNSIVRSIYSDLDRFGKSDRRVDPATAAALAVVERNGHMVERYVDVRQASGFEPALEIPWATVRAA
jgi:arginine/ornithine N-succinyltransferase beta subunit